jgi:hypothetical protein
VAPPISAAPFCRGLVSDPADVIRGRSIDEGAVGELHSREPLGVHHQLDRFNPLTRPKTPVAMTATATANRVILRI